MITRITNIVKWTITSKYEKQFKGEYFEYLVDVLAGDSGLYANVTMRLFKHLLFDKEAVEYCHKINYYISWLKKSKILKCLVFVKDAPVFVLGWSPYSEPMNYLMHIGWGQSDITLEHLKLLIEVLKLLMIIGCASNFLIYIVMSEKLREALKKTFKCREHHEERVDAIQMQTRG
ncbi:unnamed protein product [Mytilus edulis]|uniref:Uncharacterized protein n=1 Tax=Mytilus edulis TaxID=6550 RepID=A0A8S3RMA4_MYTED|nr:unnamed protein product [Mytilus edulis]